MLGIWDQITLVITEAPTVCEVRYGFFTEPYGASLF